MSKSISYNAIGMMSGTSLDGLDIACCRFTITDKVWEYELIDSEFIPYDTKTQNLLQGAFLCSAQELVKTDSWFGRFLGNKAREFIQKQTEKIDLIASHGQTIFHVPELGYTCQIGSGSDIAAIANCITVNDFRSLDVARGGQGAPLVPIGDKLLFRNYDACLNIGGFANISYRKEEQRIAFDICAVNFVLNRLSAKSGFKFDEDGELARAGEINGELLYELENLDFYKKQHPKSLGQEWVEANIFPLFARDLAVNDTIRTFTVHVARRIGAVCESISGNKILVSGGGALNKFLVECIKSECDKEIIIPSSDILEMKEAIIFAFLGVLRVREEVNCLASVTGASKDSIGGVLHQP